MARRWLVVMLAGAALLGAARSVPALSAEAVTADQRAAFEQIIHDYLLKHPEVVIQALQSAEDKVKSDAQTALVDKRRELADDPTSPVAGNPNGDITVVEFFDYRCPYCKQVEPAVEALLREDGQVKLVYKEFPILGKESVYASRIALAAVKQGKYAAFHAAMMSVKGQVTADIVQQTAKSAGLDLEKAKADMASQEIDDIIKRNYDLAQALDIRGTPAFVIGGEIVPGAVDVATLKQKIAAARKG